MGFQARCTLLFCLLFSTLQAQLATLQGEVRSVEGPVPMASIQLKHSGVRTVADEQGTFTLTEVPFGEQVLIVQSVGMQTKTVSFIAVPGTNQLSVFMKPEELELADVVVSASRYEQDRNESPVIVNVLDSKIMAATQSLAVSEVLGYQPGVRVENNCQNCGLTQVRLNGMEGAYSQILINSRPVFTALNSVYGLDQIPTNMVERVEVVRSGGSALYGSNAIAGTINIITREPLYNAWQIGSNLTLIGGSATDHSTRFNGSFVNDELSAGVSLYGMYRDRGAYDHNGDGFTEITELTNNTFGTRAFFKPGERSKISFNFNAIREYRRGGNLLELPPHLTDITEELDHNTIISGLTYDLFSKSKKAKTSAYVSLQRTKRNSYYGGLGGGRSREDSVLARNAYGSTSDLATVTGFQHSINLYDRDMLVFGAEHLYNKVKDEISGYQRLTNQTVSSLGFFTQYDWKPSEQFKVVAGARYDLVEVNGEYQLADISRKVDRQVSGVLSPRLTLMYEPGGAWQLRGGYARGFRAPQAFNEDLHISSVGGEPQFVIITDELEKELSDAYTASVRYNRLMGSTDLSILLEGFHTTLRNPFTTVSTGTSLPNGSILKEVRNGNAASVSGFNLECMLAPSPDYTLQIGGTLQQSRYQQPQLLYEPLPSESDQQAVTISQFIRTPQLYAYLTSLWQINKPMSADITATYTGSMIVPRVAGPSGRPELVTTKDFLDANIKLTYDLHLRDNLEIKLSAGVQNILYSYQDDFESGPTRDSQYIYGPMRPRSVFISLVFGNIH